MSSQRKMGWRKPVPKFIPELPSSSTVLNTSSFKRLSFASTNKDVPPLPVDWRETIERALNSDKRSAFYLPVDTEPHWMDEAQDHNITPIKSNAAAGQRQSDEMHQQASIVTNVELHQNQEPSMPRALKRERSLPQIYRPPTPPLPGQREKRDLDADVRSLPPSRYQQNVVYPDLKASRDLSAISRDALNHPSYPASFSQDFSVTAADSLEDIHGAQSYIGEAPGLSATKLGSLHKKSASSSLHDNDMNRKSRRCCDTFSSIWGDVRGFGGHIRVKFRHLLKMEHAPVTY
ncbi:hypothetical protein AcV5_001235 [Taiwanofungus camphoratus]|nr:hypothetical protein AcV5_001235 [Antrodia cinnamomea]